MMLPAFFKCHLHADWLSPTSASNTLNEAMAWFGS